MGKEYTCVLYDKTICIASHSLFPSCLLILCIIFAHFEGLLCNCVLPAGLNETKVRHVRPEDRAFEKKKLRSQSSRFPSSNAHPSLSSGPSSSSTRGSRQRSYRARSSFLSNSSPPSPRKLQQHLIFGQGHNFIGISFPFRL